MRRAGVVAATVAAMTAAGVVMPAVGADRETRRFLTGWIPYWSTDSGVSSLVTNSDLFSDVSPFWYDAKWDSGSGMPAVTPHLNDAARAAQMAKMRGHGVKILPSITDGTGRGRMASTLKSDSKRASHIADIVDVVVGNGYDGIDLDYETFAFSDGSSSWSSTRPAWVTFISELATALHKQGKLLSVTVPPMYDSDYDSSSGYWVYDLPAIGKSADLVRIMAYDYSVGSAGPIAPLPWVQKVALYSGTAVSPEKVQLGVPVYGRNWHTGTNGKCPVGQKINNGNYSMTSSRALTSLAEDGVSPSQIKRDPASGEATVSYTIEYRGLDSQGNKTNCTVSRKAFFADAKAVADRVQLARDNNLGGAALWTIGGEDTGQWPLIRDVVGSQKSDAADLKEASVRLGAPRVVTAGQQATMTGEVTVDGKASGGGTARLQFNPAGAGGWAKVDSKSVDAQGEVAFEHAPAKSGSFRIVVSKTGTHKRAVSTVARVKVRAAVSLKGAVVAFTGQKVAMSGEVQPARAGVTVLRQRLVDGQWQTVGKAKTKASGKYKFSLLPTVKNARYTYRAVSLPFDGYVRGYSPTVSFRAR